MNEAMKPTSSPVQIIITPENSFWQGRTFVLMDDGSTWETFGDKWVPSLPPIPGTIAARNAEASEK